MQIHICCMCVIFSNVSFHICSQIAFNRHNSCMWAIFLNIYFHMSPQIAYLNRCKFTLVAHVPFSQMWVFTCAFKCLLEQMQSHNSCMRATFWNVIFLMSPQMACLNRYKITSVAWFRYFEMLVLTCVLNSPAWTHKSNNSCRNAKFLHYDFQIACLNICIVTLV